MEQKFRKVVVIFIDILGSQNRENFDEWYNVMSIFSSMIEQEKELDKTHPWTIYKRETHVFSDCAYIIYDYKDNIEDYRKNVIRQIKNVFDSHFILGHLKDVFCRQSVCFMPLGQIIYW